MNIIWTNTSINVLFEYPSIVTFFSYHLLNTCTHLGSIGHDNCFCQRRVTFVKFYEISVIRWYMFSWLVNVFAIGYSMHDSVLSHWDVLCFILICYIELLSALKAIHTHALDTSDMSASSNKVNIVNYNWLIFWNNLVSVHPRLWNKQKHN